MKRLFDLRQTGPARTLFFSLFFLFVFTSVNGQSNPSAHLEQWRNGSIADPHNGAGWVNGVLNHTSAHYAEGHSMPYRMYMHSLVPGTMYQVRLQYDISHAEHHAIDFLTRYDRIDDPSHLAVYGHVPVPIDPTIGYAPVSAPQTFPFPTTCPAGGILGISNVPAADRYMTIYNGTITAMAFEHPCADPTLPVSQHDEITIYFTPSESFIIMAWGGHLARQEDWGVGNTATGVHGASYQTRFVDICEPGPDGTFNTPDDVCHDGAKTLSFQSSAVIAPGECGTCTVNGSESLCPSTSTSYSVSLDSTCLAPSTTWTISGNGAIIGNNTGSTVNVTSGTACGASFTITATTTCTGCLNGPVVCSKTVSVNDVAPPTFSSCPAGSNLGCNPTGVPAPGAATATDNCGGTPLITSSLGQIVAAGCQRTQVRTYTATDACGNSATCAQTFTWTVDVTAPVFTFCPPGSNLGCNPTAVPAPGIATATDNCGGMPVITSSLGQIVADGCQRTQVRTYTATDACGNSATCAQTFTWTVDVTAPVFTFCPPGSNLGCNPTAVPAPGAATASDNCGGMPVITSSLGQIVADGCQRTQVRTYTATDACGNSATCVQTFTWTVDVTAPVFTFCPPGSNLGCNPTAVPAPGAATATDNCGGTPMITSSLGQIVADGCQRTQVRTYTATDACGNSATCAQTFTWTVDVTAPVFTFCPPGSNLGCNPTAVPAPGAATATDNCGGTPMITSSLGQIVAAGCQRTQVRTYTATDACGNSATCAQTFTWTVDVTAPVFTFCPPGSNLGCNPTAVPAPGIATATDNCGGMPVITSSLGQIVADGCQRTQVRTYTATDACGNTATCTQTFTWTVDVTPPVFTFCPPGSNLGCNPTGVPAPGNAAATDNCGGTPTITSVLGAITANGCLRTQVRTYTATDACGNTAICTQTFTWTVDVTPPVFTFCPPDSALGCNPAGVPAPGNATATDNCGTAAITSALGPVSSLGCNYRQVRTYTATDACGNTATCTQVFTWIVDVTPPEFARPAYDQTLPCDQNGNALQSFLLKNGGASVRDCTPITWSNDFDPSNIVPGNCGGTYSVSVNFIATDFCGNSASEAATLYAADYTPPVFVVAPQDLVLECVNFGEMSVEIDQWLSSMGGGIAEDACSEHSFITYQISEDIQGENTFDRVYLFVVTDDCGNSATATATVHMTDNTPPQVIECPPGGFFECIGDIPAPNPGAVKAIDDCSSTTVWLAGIDSVGAGCPWWPLTYTYIYGISDGAGNIAYCQQGFFISDTTHPVINMPDTMYVTCVEDIPSPAVIGSIVVSYTVDNCSAFLCDALLVHDSGLQGLTRTYTVRVKDPCGLWCELFTVTYIANGTCNPLCSGTQDDWGNPGATVGGQPVATLLDAYFAASSLTAGLPGRSLRVEDAACLEEMLPGAGANDILPAGDIVAIAGDCLPAGSSLANGDGTLANSVAGHALALQLNVWYNSTYNDRDLAIQDLRQLPACLIDDYVMQRLNLDTRVADLLTLTDTYLGLGLYFPPGFGNRLNQSLANLNAYWIGCSTHPCSPLPESRADAQPVTLTDMALAPNPATDVVLLSFEASHAAFIDVRLTTVNGVALTRRIEAVAGRNAVELPLTRLASGIYWVTLVTDGQRQTLKLVVDRGGN